MQRHVLISSTDASDRYKQHICNHWRRKSVRRRVMHRDNTLEHWIPICPVTNCSLRLSVQAIGNVSVDIVFVSPSFHRLAFSRSYAMTAPLFSRGSIMIAPGDCEICGQDSSKLRCDWNFHKLFTHRIQMTSRHPLTSQRHVPVLVQGRGHEAHQGLEASVVNDISILRVTRPATCFVDRISCPVVTTSSRSTEKIPRFLDEFSRHCATTSDFSGNNVICSILIFYSTQSSRDSYSWTARLLICLDTIQ